MGNVAAQPDGKLFTVERSFIVVVEKKTILTCTEIGTYRSTAWGGAQLFAKSVASVCLQVHPRLRLDWGLGQSKGLRWQHTMICQTTLNVLAKVIKVLVGRLAIHFPNDLLFLVTNH